MGIRFGRDISGSASLISKSEIRAGAYYDSVVLMQLQRKLAALPGVDDAGVVMATHANLELLADSDLLSDDGKTAKADDLLIVVRAEKEKDALAALGQVDALMKARRSAVAQEFRSRSLAAAAKNSSQADWVLISVPGKYAVDVANEALDLDKHVFLYSDNVSVEDELGLKQKAGKKGLLVMGPDCGTAIINGVGLGFANRVRRGSIGLVGASGTGLQAITVYIDQMGGGISQAIGTGGRDLKDAIGGLSMLQGMNYLVDDDQTDVIVLVSKPPSAQVSAKLLAKALAAGKVVVVDFIGFAPPAPQIGNIHFAAGMKHAAQLAIDLSGTQTKEKSKGKKASGYLRGLFSGGTLASETLLGLQNFLNPIYSNVPIREEQKLDDPLKSKGHTILDLGEDIFTVGRLHPMMDNDLRIRRIRQEADDAEVSAILIDIVLGEGAHADPASELAPVIAEVKKKRKDLMVFALVIGSEDDPQDKAGQIEALKKSGAIVREDIAALVAEIAYLFEIETEEQGKKIETFREPLAVINVGVESFYESIKAQAHEVLQVDWRPPAGGNEDLMDILAKMRN